MGLFGLAAFSSAMKGMDQAANNLIALQQAREKHKQEEENWKLDKKIKELKIDQLENQGELSSLNAKVLKSILGEDAKQQKTILDANRYLIDSTEHQEKQKFDSLKDFAANVLESQAEETQPENRFSVENINPALTPLPSVQRKSYTLDIVGDTRKGFGVKIKKRKTKPETSKDRLEVRKLATEMAKEAYGGGDSWYSPTPEQVNEFLEEAEKFLYSGDYKSVKPKAKKEPTIEDTLRKEIDAGNISTTSEAIDFLTKSGMSKKEAINWLKERM